MNGGGADGSGMMRVIFDSNALDAILRHGDAPRILRAQAEGRLEVLTLGVVERELFQMRRGPRREALLDLHRQLRAALLAEIPDPFLAPDAALLAAARQHGIWLVSEDRALARQDDRVLGYNAFRKQLVAGFRKPDAGSPAQA